MRPMVFVSSSVNHTTQGDRGHGHPSDDAWVTPSPPGAPGRQGVRASSRRCSPRKAVGFGSEDEVAVVQAVDLVRPDIQPDFPPGQVYVRVVALRLGQL